MDLGGKQIQHDFVKVFLPRTFVSRAKHQNTALHVMFSPGIESLLVLETSRACVSSNPTSLIHLCGKSLKLAGNANICPQ